MAKPTSLRTCKSIGSRTRSKRPDVPSVSIPANGRVKKRVQSKLKVKKVDNAVSAANAADQSRTEANADSSADEKTVEKAMKKRRVSESPQRVAAVATVEQSSKRIGVDTSYGIAKPDTTTNAASASTATIEPEPTPPTKTESITTAPSTKIKQTPRQQPSHRNITPVPTLPPAANPPAFHTKWQGLSHPNPTIPPGVINIPTHHHSCCIHSQYSHGGYSWLTSKQRCVCELDGDHNTSESLSEVYLGHYGWNEKEEWKTEKWLLGMNTGGKEVLEEREMQSHLDYLPRQPHLNANMRAILMDWLVEMTMEYGLHFETVYLSVVLVDRALACVGSGNGKGMVVEKDRLQCVGCACTLIASKLLEITPPTVQDFCYISDNSYTRKEILDCEAEISSALKFNFNYETTYKYVDRFLRASFATPNGKFVRQKKTLEWMIFYFLDLSLLDYKFVGMKPSLVVAAAVYLARATLGIREDPSASVTPLTGPNAHFFCQYPRTSTGFWTKTLEHYTGYDKWDIEEAVKMLRRLHENAESNHLKSVYTKFKSEAFGKVAFKTVVNEDELGFF